MKLPNNCSESLKVVLTEMLDRVHGAHSQMDFTTDDWYHKYSWSEQTQDEFTEWLTNYVYSNKDARRELTTLTTKHKGDCKVFSGQFVWQYGWRLKEVARRSANNLEKDFCKETK